ncbi:MAG: thioredoxin [Lentisphaeria bacterium]|jgi:thioredoxin 1
MAASLKELKASEFDAAIAQGTVLVDFWAPWCPPCRMQLPILEALAAEIGDAAKICKVNVDEEGEIAGRFKVSSIPTLILFKDGKVAKQFVGLQQAATLKQALS